jgi:hypothetical protein
VTFKKLLKYYLGYEVAVTGYNLVQSRVPSLPSVPLPSLLMRILPPSLFGSAVSVAGMTAITPDGSQFTLASDAVLSGQNVLTQGKSFPVLSIQGSTYFLDTPTSATAAPAIATQGPGST